MSNQKNVVLRFDKVSFAYNEDKPVLNEVSFVVRKGVKITIMGQNGAGKSTIFQLISGTIAPDYGSINLSPNMTVAIAKQVIPRDMFCLTIREFFQSYFKQKVYDIDPKIEKALKAVNLVVDKEKIVKSLSGGEQARLLLASAIIQNPDLLLLDEPTNNLDKHGIEHLTKFLVNYKKTCIVISHDANFLNKFTQGVLYLDIFTHSVEQYIGNYFDLLTEISARVKKENRKNAQLAKKIQENKDKANYFAHKGGKMRLVAKKMRKRAETMEQEKVNVRKEDRVIRPFIIPCQQGIGGEILSITSFSVMKNGKQVWRKARISLTRGERLVLIGRNGIGKTTLLESFTSGKAKGAKVAEDIGVGYYRQDFSTLNFSDTIYDSLGSVCQDISEQELRSVAAGFLIDSSLIYAKIGSLSEGQKGLVSFARLVLQRPGLLVLDEPTNHINFRHLPVIASALNKYEGAMVLVSHDQKFMQEIHIDQTIDLNTL